MKTCHQYGSRSSEQRARSCKSPGQETWICDNPQCGKAYHFTPSCPLSAPELTVLTKRQRWSEQWRFARALARRWWNIGHLDSGVDDSVDGARRQAPLAFQCLVARNKVPTWELWKGGSGWFYTRPCKYGKPHLP